MYVENNRSKTHLPEIQIQNPAEPPTDFTTPKNLKGMQLDKELLLPQPIEKLATNTTQSRSGLKSRHASNTRGREYKELK